MRLLKKVAIISGAAQGIGEACARLFASEGAYVVLGDIKGDQVERVAAAINAGSAARAVAAHLDVSDPASVARFVELAKSRFGGVDICVCNAGISRPKAFLELTADDWDQTMSVNLRGAFLLGQAAAREMVAQDRGGSIVHMSSVNAVVAIEGIAPYCASKGGVNQLTKAMALALAHHDIRVNAIGPGTISTEMVTGRATPESHRLQMSRTPLGRAGEADEIARVALFLASEDASYVTGEIIYADGGRLALNYTVPLRE